MQSILESLLFQSLHVNVHGKYLAGQTIQVKAIGEEKFGE